MADAGKHMEDELIRFLEPVNRMLLLEARALVAAWPGATGQIGQIGRIAVSHWITILWGEPTSETRRVAGDIAKLCAAARAAAPVMDVDLGSLTQFWASSLGQKLFQHDGFPQRSAMIVEACGVLRCSRPNIAWMAQQGTLERDEKAVTRESLVRSWIVRRARAAAKEADAQRKKEAAAGEFRP